MVGGTFAVAAAYRRRGRETMVGALRVAAVGIPARVGCTGGAARPRRRHGGAGAQRGELQQGGGGGSIWEICHHASQLVSEM